MISSAFLKMQQTMRLQPALIRSQSALMFGMCRPFSAKVIVNGLPYNWTDFEIKKRFEIISGLQDVYRIKSSTG